MRDEIKLKILTLCNKAEKDRENRPEHLFYADEIDELTDDIVQLCYAVEHKGEPNEK